MASKPISPKDKIEEKVPVEIEQLPFSYVEKHFNKTTKLLANSGAVKPVEGQSKWFQYRFNTPVFIYRVVVNATNYPEYKNFEIEAITVGGERIVTPSRPSSGRIFLEVAAFCQSISFKPPIAYFTGAKTIDSVELYGFSQNDAGKFIQFARDLDSLKEQAFSEIERKEFSLQQTIRKAEAANAEIAQAQTETAKLKSESDRLKALNRRLESEKNDLMTKVEAGSESLSSIQRNLQAAKAEADLRFSEKEQIDKQISQSTEILSDLKSNIDLFPSELDGFVKQGASNTRTLFWLSLAPILVIVAMFILLIKGAADLSTKITPDMNINITVLIISRMPYVIISLTIIAACYQIARYFISELININRQRLNLTKVSIIAKDVSNAAEAGLDLDESERYSMRVRLKMEMLKDHLKGYISEDFGNTLPQQITSILRGFPILGKHIDDNTDRSGNVAADK